MTSSMGYPDEPFAKDSNHSCLSDWDAIHVRLDHPHSLDLGESGLETARPVLVESIGDGGSMRGSTPL